ncbi:RadC family protein [Rhizosphaericola mali]|uniref:DNA repair protein RadC n=1 Tax=Rhizosphaericola mali TaxID=2545455 RepID=A0A5P2G7I2_9BACT|nr:DNA repair protein RadC [Rhizosphaericola mali]QES89730.1 DNA repair protein RadC [Rhizosphaericola mali]
MSVTSIKNWAEDDRPREKLLLKGKSSLSDAELIAIIINNGTKEASAVQVAQKLLASCDNQLQKLAGLTVKDIQGLKIKGIGEAKSVAIAAALELGIRREVISKKKETIRTSEDAAAFLQAQFQHYAEEVFVVVFLNTGNKIIHYEIVSHGGHSATIVDTKVIMKKALQQNATKLIISHNHPSGNLQPSKADDSVTQKIQEAARLLDIEMLDHIIVSDMGYYSYGDEGRL